MRRRFFCGIAITSLQLFVGVGLCPIWKVWWKIYPAWRFTTVVFSGFWGIVLSHVRICVFADLGPCLSCFWKYVWILLLELQLLPIWQPLPKTVYFGAVLRIGWVWYWYPLYCCPYFTASGNRRIILHLFNAGVSGFEHFWNGCCRVSEQQREHYFYLLFVTLWYWLFGYLRNDRYGAINHSMSAIAGWIFCPVIVPKALQ